MTEVKIYSVFGGQTARPFVINKASAEAVTKEKEINSQETLFQTLQASAERQPQDGSPDEEPDTESDRVRSTYPQYPP